MLQLLFLGLLGHAAEAGVVAPRDPLITAAPVVPRAVTTAGYYSTGYEDGTTLWGTVTFDAEGQVVATSGDQFQICATDSCVFYSCSGDYWVDSTTSSYCGTSSSMTCSYNRLYTDVSDQSPLTNFWCDTMTETGYEVYQVTPTPASSPSSIVSATTTPSSSHSSTTRSSSSSASAGASTTTPTPDDNKKSTPIGAIVGGVIGGLAVIGAIIVGIIFLMKRNKSKPQAANPAYQPVNPPAQAGQYPPPNGQYPQSPQPYQAYPEMGMAAAPLPEKTPAATSNVQGYYAPPEGPPGSPVPQYSTNNGAVTELPAQRM